jgi:hypothetical protein
MVLFPLSIVSIHIVQGKVMARVGILMKSSFKASRPAVSHTQSASLLPPPHAPPLPRSLSFNQHDFQHAVSWVAGLNVSSTSPPPSLSPPPFSPFPLGMPITCDLQESDARIKTMNEVLSGMRVIK